MEQLGAKSNQFGTLSVRGNKIGDGPPIPEVSQAFTISQKLLIEPLSLADQIDNDRILIAPPYLKDDNSLKYVFRVEASKDLSNPNNKKVVVEGEVLGNVGYENELYNGGETKYSVSNVSYKRADSTTTKGIELTTDEIIVSFDFNNTQDSPFQDSLTRIVFEHRYLPTPEELYREPEFPDLTNPNEARNRVLKENFFFDRIECVVGFTATLSDNNGGIDQIIQDCTPTYISNSKVRVVATIKMSATAVSRIASQSNPEYKLLVSTKDVDLTRAKSDKSKIRVDFNKYFIETTDPSMVQITNTFLDLTNEDVDAGSQSLTVRTEDAVLGVASFTLDRNDIPNFNRSDSDISFLSATAQMIAKNSTGDFFVLDTYSTDFFELEIIDDPTYGTVPFIDITEDRGFTTPADDLRKNARIKRRIDLDNAGKFAYEFRYPFIVRSEDWQPLNTVNNEFLDPTQQNDGKNHDWMHYFIGTDWNLFMRIEIVATKDGLPLAPYVQESILLTEDYDDGFEWDTPVTKTYLTSNLDPIDSGSQFGVSFIENTLFEADANYTNPDVPTLPDLEFVMMINVFEKTNYLGQFRIYTQYDTDLSNQWIGLLGALTAEKTNPSGTTFRISAELKPQSPEQTFKFSWRIYDKRDDSGIPFGKLKEDGALKLMENGISKELE